MILLVSTILILVCLYFTIGVFDIRQNVFVNSMNSVEKGNICLTFDDGPDPRMTPMILDILQKHKVKATFFLIGEAIHKNQDIVKRIHKEGHTIGCHTFQHKSTFPIYSSSKMETEITQTNNLITAITSMMVVLFRPPFGITNPNINKVLKRMKMTSIGWDVRSLDTITKDSKKLYNRVIKGIDKGGSIILFHDRCKSTLDILEQVILYCKKKGLQFYTINEE
ncbi:MAG: polysaccharide deacetylase family protein [Flavobacteriales bacterium]|nr:polysaccharide deacetylase family protein [Flavobacteriales bacterium]